MFMYFNKKIVELSLFFFSQFFSLTDKRLNIWKGENDTKWKAHWLECISIRCRGTNLTSVEQKKETTTRGPGERKGKTKKNAWRAGNASDASAISFGFASDWSRGWREFPGPITECLKRHQHCISSKNYTRANKNQPN